MPPDFLLLLVEYTFLYPFTFYVFECSKNNLLAENIRYSKVNRSGGDWHWKDSLLLRVPKRKGHTTKRALLGSTTLN
jgi:hypothetical protein